MWFKLDLRFDDYINVIYLWLKYLEGDMADGGSGIKIKKKNVGKFTEYCGGKVTQECISKGKSSKSAAVRKRAVFAENAKKWNPGKATNFKG